MHASYSNATAKNDDNPFPDRKLRKLIRSKFLKKLHDDGNGNGQTTVLGPCVHTNAFSKVAVCIFVVIEDTSMDSCPHYRFDVCSTVHAKTFKTIKLYVGDSSSTLYACYKDARLRYFR